MTTAFGTVGSGQAKMTLWTITTIHKLVTVFKGQGGHALET